MQERKVDPSPQPHAPDRDASAPIALPSPLPLVFHSECDSVSGAHSDLQRLFDEVAKLSGEYQHNLRWGDGNGHSHVRAALLGPSLTFPFVDRRLQLGTWQQITHCDFDNRPRARRLVVQIIGE